MDTDGGADIVSVPLVAIVRVRQAVHRLLESGEVMDVSLCRVCSLGVVLHVLLPHLAAAFTLGQYRPLHLA